MSSSHADTAINSFLEVEERIRRFLQAVPLMPEHNKVHSPQLASILLDTCSIMETTFKSTMDNKRYDGVKNIAQLRAKRTAPKPPYLTINDLRDVFYGDGLYDKQVWHLESGDRSIPFYAWRPKGGTPPTGNPSWWKVYNDVKHHRYDNAHKATLKMTLHAVKGLFLTLVQSLEFRHRLTERGVIRARSLSTKSLLVDTAQWEPLPIKSDVAVVAATRLFGYKFKTSGSPDRASSVSLFL